MRLIACSSLVLLTICCSPLQADEQVVIAEGASPQAPQQPQLHIDGSRVVHLTYAIGDTLYYARSVDGATSFTESVTLPPAHDISLGMRRGPRIASTGKGVCVTVIGGRQGKGKDGDLLAFRSTDDGRTWQGPTTVNDVADAAREGLHAMAAGPSGELCCVWLDLRARGTQIRSAVSKDGGETWSKNVLVYRSPDGSVCECCHPSVAFDREGRLHVLWRNSVGGARDMFLASSADGGLSFDDAHKLGQGTWPQKACPMDGGALSPLPEGAIATVWRRQNQVYLLNSVQAKEELLGAGEQPWLAATRSGPAAVWLTKRGSKLLMQLPGEKPGELASGALDPVIAADPSGDLLVVAWEQPAGAQTRIVCRAISSGDLSNKPSP